MVAWLPAAILGGSILGSALIGSKKKKTEVQQYSSEDFQRVLGEIKAAAEPKETSLERLMRQYSEKALGQSWRYRSQFDPVLAKELLEEYQRTSKGEPSVAETRTYERGRERVQRESESSLAALKERMAQRGMLYSGSAERAERLERSGALSRMAELSRDVAIQQDVRQQAEAQQALENLLAFRESFWRDMGVAGTTATGERADRALALQEVSMALQQLQAGYEREQEEQAYWQNLIGSLGPLLAGFVPQQEQYTWAYPTAKMGTRYVPGSLID